MTSPNFPAQPNFNYPPPGPGVMPPQPPQYNAPPHYYQQPGPPQYGNMPPQHQYYPQQQYPQHQQYPQQYPQHPNQYGNQAMPPVSAFLAGYVQSPPGFDRALVPVWDPGSETGVTRPVQSKVSARPPRDAYNAIFNWEAGQYPHEWRADDKQRAQAENYQQRGAEKVFDALPRMGRFLGRVAFQGTTTSPERVQAGYRRKEVGGVLSGVATVGWAALHLTGLTLASYVARTGTRFYSNYVTLKRTFKDSLRTAVARKGEAPHQIRDQVTTQSPYHNPHPHLPGNTMPTSPGQARKNQRQAARNQRAQQLQAQPSRAQRQIQKANAKIQKANAKANARAMQRYQKQRQRRP